MIRYPRTIYASLLILCTLGALISWNVEHEEHARARRAIQACDAGWRACRTAQGYAPQHCRLIAGKLVSVAGGTETPCTEPAEDETVCGQGWSACYAASTGGVGPSDGTEPE